MTQEDDSGTSPPFDVEAAVADDKRRVMLRLGDVESAPFMVALDTASVDALVAALGSARSQMLEPVPTDFATIPIAAFDPLWKVGPDEGKNLPRLLSAIRGLAGRRMASRDMKPVKSPNGCGRLLRSQARVTRSLRQQLPLAATALNDRGPRLLLLWKG